MSEVAAPTTPKDGFVSFGVTFVLLTLVGNLSTHFWLWEPPSWTWNLVRPACLALFAALVGLYALCTGPGRRTGWRAFLLCGFLVPGMVWLLAIFGYMLPLSYDAFSFFEALVAGFGVGYNASGGGPTPFLVSTILWVLGIVLAVVAAPALRQLVRKPPTLRP
jgi:hypothetical protein